MPAEHLRNYLDSQNVKFVSIKHSRAYTAQEIAASAHISGKEVAKTVMVKIDGKLAMCVLPANEHLDIDRLQEVTRAKKVDLADEHEFVELFPDCEIGAMPPFGNLYDLDVYVAEDLTRDEEIAFNAGTHTELFRMPYKAYAKLVNPRVVQIGT